MRFFNRILIIITLSIISCTGNRYFTTKKNVSEERIKPPVAKIVPHETVMHGEKLIDNYSWLKDKTRTDPDVIDYLKAENEYTEKMLKHTEKVQEELFNEILSRIKETDLNVPTKIDNYYYYSRREKGKQYMIFCRKKESLDADEEIILDVNELAEGYSFFYVRSTLMSTNHRYLGYLADTTGAEKYALYIKDLRTGELLDDKAYPVNNIAWANDNKTLFYTTINEKKQADKLYRHTLGTDIKDDKLMYQENDGSFYIYIYKTRSKEYLIMVTGSVVTSENRYLKADKPLDEFKLIQSREKGVEYYIAHHSDKFFIKTNTNEAKNYKIMETSVDNPSKENWKEFIAHRDSVFITDYDVFKDYMVVYEREKGLEKPRIIDFNTKKTHYVEFPEPIYGFYSESNPNFDTDLLRFAYTSLTTPWSIFDYNMKTKKRELKKQYEVLGGYDATQYKSERIFAKAKDGTLVPISLVYKTETFTKNGENPLLLNAYGCYGISFDPYFSSIRLSLLNRGFVFAIAHVRGGGDLGKDWHEQGKLLNKKNTFTDFISCAEHLISALYTSEPKLVIQGGSAGGLLIGVVINMRPELFKIVIADVPAVDAINTMIDTSLAGVEFHYDEMGNPNDKEYFDYMKSYDPYQNVKSEIYPHLLITNSFHDSRVNYWGPAKWTAKLRALKNDNSILLLKTNMSAGHGGVSGRYDFYKEVAFKYAFILDILGIE